MTLLHIVMIVFAVLGVLALLSSAGESRRPPGRPPPRPTRQYDEPERRDDVCGFCGGMICPKCWQCRNCVCHCST